MARELLKLFEAIKINRISNPNLCKKFFAMEENKKLSIAQCKQILKQNGGKDYTDEQVSEIRDLYSLAEIEFEIITKVGLEPFLKMNDKRGTD